MARRRFDTELMFECQREGLWEAYRWRPLGGPKSKSRLGIWFPTGVTIEKRGWEPGSREGWWVFSPYLDRWGGDYVTDAAAVAAAHVDEMPVEHRKRGCPVCDSSTCQVKGPKEI